MSINPADSEIFGALWGTPEMRALFSDPARFQLMLDVEAALARAEAKLGLVPQAAADAVARAARFENLHPGAIAEDVRKAGQPVAALVAELGRITGGDAARHIHLGATTQDIVDTALVLQMRRGFEYVRRDLVALARALAERAARYRDTPIAGRTHLQHAVPISFGYKCAVWAAPLAAHLERLDQAARRVLVVQFGGAAGTLATLGARGAAVAQALADELGLGVPDLPWHVARDTTAEAAALLGLICGSLAKFALDVALLMQSEVAEVFEPHEPGRGGSSTMPQKRNPVAAEYILAAAREVHAQVGVMMSAMAQDHERATGPWQSEALALPQCFVLTSGALAHGRAIAEGMSVDTERMRRNLGLSAGLIMAEAVAAGLTPAMGRAAAHHVLQRASERALGEGRSLSEVLRDDPEVRKHLGAEQIDRLMDPAGYLGSAGVFVDRVVARIARLA
ncbi:MAG TPA: 3-carboxy-cis,cis-muconate cycloisomerase [Candidatus Binataceae bacterium]|nr:3-carboxy-cis,cis-muconate cycloisomerase [Candidatus Binataceae bacterium]